MTNYIEVPELTLQSSIGSADTSMIVTGALRYDGTIITQADFGGSTGRIFATISPNTTSQESVEMEWVSNVAGVMTVNLVRGLSGVSPYSTGGTAYSHTDGSIVVLSNSAALFNKLAAKDNDEAITGDWTVPTPATSTSIANKAYADTKLALAGGTLTGFLTLNADATDALHAVTKQQVVLLTEAQTIAGVKTFSSAPIIPTATGSTEAVNKGQMETYIAANSGDIKASESAFGTLKLSVAATDPANPVAFGNNDPRIPSEATSTNPFATQKRTGFRTVTAGATINGATLPVPVYQNKTDNEFYACDANDTSAMKFLGFATSNGVDAGDMDVQLTGVVGGFTVLSEGEKYYVQDTAGTIGTTAGTYEILVGVAISETELLIQKGKRYASGVEALGTATGSNVITCGFRPSKIKMHGQAITGTEAISVMSAIWTNGTLIGVGSIYDDGITGVTAETAKLYTANTSNYFTFTIGSVTDTGFTITYTETGTFTADAGYVWEAEGEL